MASCLLTFLHEAPKVSCIRVCHHVVTVLLDQVPRLAGLGRGKHRNYVFQLLNKLFALLEVPWVCQSVTNIQVLHRIRSMEFVGVCNARGLYLFIAFILALLLH